MIQLCILKITGYGPWTLTQGSDREHKLQMLQAQLYKDVQNHFSKVNGLVFLNRADEFFVVTSGLGFNEHVDIQRSLESSSQMHLTMSIGCAKTPFEANLLAHRAMTNNVVLNDEDRAFGYVADNDKDNNKDTPDVTVMHLDVDNLTSRGDTNSPYEISSFIFGLYSKMTEFFLARNSLAFFLGGDNFMVVASKAGRDSVDQFIKMIHDDDKITLNCGIGNGRTGREAAALATKSLDTIRDIRDSGGEKPDVYELSC